MKIDILSYDLKRRRVRCVIDGEAYSLPKRLIEKLSGSTITHISMRCPICDGCGSISYRGIKSNDLRLDEVQGKL